MKPIIVKSRQKVSEDQILGETRTDPILSRWRSSIWKLLWKDLLLYTIVYLVIGLVYRFALPEEYQIHMESLIKYCHTQNAGLPLTFLLGFYVSLVVSRWWNQYCSLPWPDTIATCLRAVKVKEGEEEEARITRRTIMRYCVLAYLLCLRRLSLKLRKKFPTMRNVITTGLLTEAEAKRIGEEDSVRQHGGSNWWIPLLWSTEIAENDTNISSAPVYGYVQMQLAGYRQKLTDVLNYGHVPIPLVYSQVVHLAVYFYFGVSLISEQWIIWRKEGDEILYLYYPLFMTMKFLFYFGWLRVAETLYNPFGEDDDDFALEELIDRHVKVAMRIVDKIEDPPLLQKDAFWDIPNPKLMADKDDDHNDDDDVTIELITSQEKRDPRK
eukprot:GFUD01103697.1.p1 GENE.GFUD01103697.1~~GFUD01103697.1.p1  ORF type:complete len:382 (-),score=95.97 GFUD01103697.1:90-1235(-)